MDDLNLMRDSKYTARYISDQLKRLEDELKELSQACSTVEDELGNHTVAYNLLNKAYQDKKKETNAYANSEWKVY